MQNVDKVKASIKGVLERQGLSPSELPVITLTLQGKSNQEVADKLCIAHKTVKFHLTNCYRKMGVGGKTQVYWKLLPKIIYYCQTLDKIEEKEKIKKEKEKKAIEEAEKLPKGSKPVQK